VSYHDPYVPALEENGHTFASVPLTGQALAAADCVLIVTDHTSLDNDQIRTQAKLTVDTRHALARR
jgi:UDP-N-acetyl-D-glucosamine dehydrogenase